MDPRPIQFAYRRPRHNNLTYQSYGLSESMMHVASYNKRYKLPIHQHRESLKKRDFPNPEKIQQQQNSKWKVNDFEVNRSHLINNQNSNKEEFKGERLSKSVVFDKPNDSMSIKNEKDSLTAWTSSLTSKRHLQGQDKVYEFQQKPYDILNFKPREQPNGHRIYPRFSLQHKMVTRNISSIPSP